MNNSEVQGEGNTQTPRALQESLGVDDERVEFSEYRQPWGTLPAWVRFLVAFGYKWHTDEERARRIALLSMPCDSAAAGLVALGAMIRGLSSPQANDVSGHSEALTRYVGQYLKSCRTCETRCHPKLAGCGFAFEASGRVRHSNGKVWEVSDQTDLLAGNIRFARNGVVSWLIPKFATDWQIDGEPFPLSTNNSGALRAEPYSAIIEDVPILPNNLRSSYSGLCLAGRIAGKEPSREAYASIRFRVEKDEYALPELLSVHEWHEREVSRMTFFNGRTQQLDRVAYSPGLVVADGDGSFLRVRARREFQNSDIVGVIHRTVERDELEAVGNDILGLRQWYDEDVGFLDRLPTVPKGISVSILRRRTT